jgi:NAD(P)-dependent dehydrogenase (short-subunit alcohol dehydrogenase family)
MFQLNNKIAIVTGGGSGIGKDVCKVLAKQGAHVIVVDLNTDSAKGTVDEITANENSAEALTLDVTQLAAVTTAFEKLNGLNILVNCAGISHIGSATTTSEADFEKVFQVNVKGMFHCLQAGVNAMKKSGGGSIVNISSIAAKVGLSDRFAYSMSKGAILAMTLSVAKDFVKKGIRCNCISPARVHTPFVDGFLNKHYPGQQQEMFHKLSQTQPIGRMGKPDEIASLAFYLCSQQASFITGCDYPIDGGFLRLNS